MLGLIANYSFTQIVGTVSIKSHNSQVASVLLFVVLRIEFYLILRSRSLHFDLFCGFVWRVEDYERRHEWQVSRGFVGKIFFTLENFPAHYVKLRNFKSISGFLS